MFQTKNDLPGKARRCCISVLQQRLSDGLDLMQQAKQAHWNVKGPNFISLHELFDKVSEEIEVCVDDLAERIVQLGGIAMGTCKVTAKDSSLTNYPTNIIEGHDHVVALSNSLADFAKFIRESVDEAMNQNDQGTADLLIGISRKIDKNLWFVEAHLSPEKLKEAAA